jgi:hypothetical protein
LKSHWHGNAIRFSPFAVRLNRLLGQSRDKLKTSFRTEDWLLADFIAIFQPEASTKG